MVKMFFEPFNAVDTNDQYRQGILKLEENWKTNSWAIRAISTDLGVIFVNSHLAMQILKNHEQRSNSTLKSDMDKLAYRLIVNPYLTDEQRELRNALVIPQQERHRRPFAAIISWPALLIQRSTAISHAI
jgi:hypothetical protein